MNGNDADRRAIAELARLYAEGARAGQSGIMRPAFHPQATVRGAFGRKPVDISIDAFFAYVDGEPPAKDLKLDVAAIDLCGDAGTMRVECVDWNGARFTDFFTVLRRDGAWSITSKVFFTHPRAKA